MTNGLMMISKKMELKLLIKMKRMNNTSSQDFSQNYFLTSKEKDKLFKKPSNKLLKFGVSKYLFYSLWLIGFSIIFGSIIFFIHPTIENESKNINIYLER